MVGGSSLPANDQTFVEEKGKNNSRSKYPDGSPRYAVLAHVLMRGKDEVTRADITDMSFMLGVVGEMQRSWTNGVTGQNGLHFEPTSVGFRVIPPASGGSGPGVFKVC